MGERMKALKSGKSVAALYPRKKREKKGGKRTFLETPHTTLICDQWEKGGSPASSSIERGGGRKKRRRRQKAYL